MPGETLPPVIIPVEGDDSDFLDMLDRDVAALRAAAGEIDALLAGLDLGAALSDSLGTANLAALNTDEIAQGLSEAMGGVGAALGEDIGSQLGDAVTGAGVEAGAALAEGVAEGAAGAGDAVGQQLGEELSGKAQAVGAHAGEALAESFDGAAGGIGQDAAHNLESALSGLPATAASAGEATGHALNAGAAAGVATLGFAGAAAGAELVAGIAAGAAAVTGIVAGIADSIQAQLIGELSQAGDSSGAELGASLGDGAQSTAGSVASNIARALEADLSDALGESGGTAGISLVQGIADGAKSGGKQVASRVASAIEAPLADAMGTVGQVGADALLEQISAALNVGTAEMDAFAERLKAQLAQAPGYAFSTATAVGAGPGPVAQAAQEAAEEAPAATAAIEQALGDAEVEAITAASARAEQAAAEAGPRIATAMRTSMASVDRGGGIPGGPNVDPSDLLASLSPEAFDPLVPDLASEFSGAFTRASKLGLQEAVAAAQSEWGAQLAELVPSPDRFASLTDKGIALWTEEVRAQVAEAGPGLADAFSNAMALGLGGMDWSSLTGAQATALMGAIRGSLVEGASEAAPQAEAAMEELGVEATEALAAAVASTGSAVADALIEKIVEARQAATAQLVELAVAAGEQGEEAGGRFAAFFSQAADSVRLVFSKDPEKAAEAGAEAGREYADAMVAELEAELGQVPEAAAEEGDASGGAFGRFFSSAASAALGVFARDPAAAAGAEAGVEFGDAMVEQLEARLAEIGQAGGEGFAETVEQQLEAQLRLAAAEATAAYERQLVEGIAEAEAEAQAQLGEMRLDVNLDRMFSNLAQELPAEFVSAFSQVRQGIAVTEEEFAQFSEYGQQQLRALVTVLDTDGVQGADRFMEALSTKSFNERLNPASLMAGGSSEIEGVTSELGGVEKAASGATSAFGGMAGMMGGPVMMGMMGMSMVLPMLSGLFSSTAASASDFTSAVAQDSGAVGDNTAATIQSTLAKTNLAGISQQLGLSQAQLIEYAAGEANVQAQVTAAYNAQTSALEKNQQAGRVTAGRSGANADNPAAQSLSQLEQQKAALDAVTGAVAAAVDQDAANSAALLAAEQTTKIYNASVNALGESQLLQVQSTKMSNQATVEYGSRLLAAEQTASYASAAIGAAGVNMELQGQATEYTNEATVQYGNVVMGAYRDATMFNSAIDASYISMQEQAQTSAISSVGLLNLGDSQSGLNRQLVDAEMSYTQAQQGANAYDSAVTALSGTTNTLLGDEAAFTTALGGVTTAVQQNGTSLNVTNEKGAANVTVMTQIATAAANAAGALYQNEVSTKGATQAYTDANTKLAQEKQAFIDAADKAGMNKNAVQALANELFQLPKSITIPIDANTSQASAAISQLQGQLSSALGAESSLNSGTNLQTISQYEHALNAPRKAAGGPVQAGALYHINESGAEGFFVPPADGYIVPHEAMAGATSGGSPYAAGSGGGGVAPISVHVYLDSREITASVRTESQQYKTRNSQTGLN